MVATVINNAREGASTVRAPVDRNDRKWAAFSLRLRHPPKATSFPRSFLCTKDSLTRHGLRSEADRLKIVSRSLLIRMFLGADFDSSPADLTGTGHPGIRRVNSTCCAVMFV